MILTPMPAQPSEAIAEAGRPIAAVSADRRYAELTVEAFGAMSHVTLHWGPCSPHLRSELERELDRGLESAAPTDNSASGWFVSISGMIFGAVLVILSMMIFMIFFAHAVDFVGWVERRETHRPCAMVGLTLFGPPYRRAWRIRSAPAPPRGEARR